MKHAASIDKGGGLQSVFLGHAGDCALQFGRRRPVYTAADIVHGGAGGKIARPESVWRKSPYQRRAAEEAVDQRHLLAAIAGDIAALGADHADQVAVERLIITQILGGTEEVHVAAEPS